MELTERADRLQYLVEQVQQRARRETSSPSSDNRFLLLYECERLEKINSELITELSFPFRALAHQIQPVADGLTEDNWDEDWPTYHPDKPCSFLAHLSHHFSPAEAVDGMLQQVDRCSFHRLELAFCAAGAVWPPLYSERWPIHPSQVVKNLANIKELPPDTDDLGLQANWIRATRKQFGITADPNEEAKDR